jgi:hypothetical protein
LIDANDGVFFSSDLSLTAGIFLGFIKHESTLMADFRKSPFVYTFSILYNLTAAGFRI